MKKLHTDKVANVGFICIDRGLVSLPTLAAQSVQCVAEKYFLAEKMVILITSYNFGKQIWVDLADLQQICQVPRHAFCCDPSIPESSVKTC